MNNKVTIVLVDDHVLFRKGLATLIASFDNFSLLFEANNGKEFIAMLQPDQLPDIVLLDINMPEMDGYETCAWLKKNHPGVKVLSLSMYDNEQSIVRMFKAGAKGYILKDSEPAELRDAMNSLHTKGYYYSEMVTGKLIHSINEAEEEGNTTKFATNLSDREITFLKLVCTELTYKEIADQMCLSARTIDGYRDSLFAKLQVKTRVGLVTYALKHGIVLLDKLP
ncbi:response regulator transcription factor [Chitinophaga sp. Cy-1792]|uniref:response regulator transcription factor n=1 Tax=Chitinophaga sp. Cy-1792 TaxID=2608339 RepID=UPI00141F778C|nr:response regulator transcription factor [Chitinophaga sp. Cy-1792]NIG53810.1 response regulator transcription factor [Chitinophaga sp. Cy-1792]